MDQVYDKLLTEVPFDAVSNDVNASIMEYKDGKDNFLAHGQTDIKEKQDYIDNFYNHLRKDLLTDKKNNEIVSNGTEIGRFLFTTSNDMVEKATESFNGYTGNNDNIIKVLKFIIQKQVIPSCGIYIKLNKDVRNLVKKGFAKNIKISSLNKNKKTSNTYLKNILEQTVGDIIIDTPISSLKDFLRDSINTFTKNSDDQDNSYYTRYAKRYKLLSDLISRIAINTNNILDGLEKMQKAADDVSGLEGSNISDILNQLAKSVSDIGRFYSEIKDASITKDDDFFPWVIQKYKVNTFSFTTTPSNSLNDEYFDGITKSALEDAIKTKELKNAFINNDNERIVFATIKSSKKINDIINEMQKYYNSLNANLLIEKTKKKLLNIVGDITLDEYISQIDKYDEITSTFKSNADEAIGSLIDSTIRVSNILGTLSAYTSRTLEKLNPSSGSESNIIRMLSSIAGWTCVDILTVLSAMHYINANDLVMKLFLYENTVKFINYINDCINSSDGDNKNDK